MKIDLLYLLSSLYSIVTAGIDNNINTNALIAGCQNDKQVAEIVRNNMNPWNCLNEIIFGRNCSGKKSVAAAINTHMIATSSRSWPIKLSVAWKYAELSPTIKSRTHTPWIAGLTIREYGRNKWINIGGRRKKRILLNWKWNRETS